MKFLRGHSQVSASSIMSQNVFHVSNTLASSPRAEILHSEFRLGLIMRSVKQGSALHFVTVHLSSKQKLTRAPCQYSQYRGVRLLACCALSSRAEQNTGGGTLPGLVPSYPWVSFYCFCTVLSHRLFLLTEDKSTALSEAVAPVQARLAVHISTPKNSNFNLINSVILQPFYSYFPRLCHVRVTVMTSFSLNRPQHSHKQRIR